MMGSIGLGHRVENLRSKSNLVMVGGLGWIGVISGESSFRIQPSNG